MDELLSSGLIGWTGTKRALDRADGTKDKGATAIIQFDC
jgi:hypothetical protein